ncbi:MAG: hypothetical protein DI551_06160 [Micavibrio aeruginosavorus]|uniref:Uncharacterized protein n=1 Tax=Micavibrio aeruginosavorus TaxID=349221 RepID=A0A2W5MYQ3_9BACT|nr:MAG: hypothetical protein DI551_06160 [Micavibrio aeruginosavorus]
MNWKTFALRFAGLIALAIAGFYLYAFSVHMMIRFEVFPPELIDKAFGTELTRNTVYVCVFTFLLGFISLFIKDKVRSVLYFAPLYAPILFGIIYTLMHR